MTQQSCICNRERGKAGKGAEWTKLPVLKLWGNLVGVASSHQSRNPAENKSKLFFTFCPFFISGVVMVWRAPKCSQKPCCQKFWLNAAALAAWPTHSHAWCSVSTSTARLRVPKVSLKCIVSIQKKVFAFRSKWTETREGPPRAPSPPPLWSHQAGPYSRPWWEPLGQPGSNMRSEASVVGSSRPWSSTHLTWSKSDLQVRFLYGFSQNAEQSLKNRFVCSRWRQGCWPSLLHQP